MNVPWKGTSLNGFFIFQPSIIRGYVSFQGVLAKDHKKFAPSSLGHLQQSWWLWTCPCWSSRPAGVFVAEKDTLQGLYIWLYIAEASTNFSRQMNTNPSRLGEHDRNQVCLGFTFNHDFFQQKDQRLLGFSGISLYLLFKKKAAILDHHNCLEEQEVLMEEIQLNHHFYKWNPIKLGKFSPVLNPPRISESSTGLRPGSNGPQHQSFSWILNEIWVLR